MTIYTIELTDAEVKAMGQVSVDVQGWVTNLVKERARIAMDEIYADEVLRMTADPTIEAIPADKEVVVLAAELKSAAQQQAENLILELEAAGE